MHEDDRKTVTAPESEAPSAPTPAPPTTLDEIDALRLERYELIGENMQIKFQAFSREVSDAVAAMRQKYAMSGDDSFDLAKRQIRRHVP